MNTKQIEPTENNDQSEQDQGIEAANGAAEPHRSLKRKFGMPSWTLALLILVLIGVLIWAGDALLRSRQRLPDMVQQNTATVRPIQTPTLRPAPPSPTAKPAIRARAPVSLTTQARRLSLSEPSSTQPCTPTNEALSADLALGIASYQSGDWEQAERALDKVVATAQAQESACRLLLAQTHLYRGNLSALASDYERALSEYQAGLGLTTSAADQALLYTNQAGVHYIQGDTEASLQAANAAIELAPELANAYYHRATAYRALDQVENARADLDRAIQLDPEHARAYASRGLLYHNANELDTALGDYGRSLELDPWAAEVYLNRGGTYATLGDLDAALQDYSQALALQPDDAEAYYNRGTVYAIQERYSEALQDLNRAIEIDPDFAQVYGNRGLIYKALGETEAAIADLETFIELTDNPEWKAMIEQHLADLKDTQN